MINVSIYYTISLYREIERYRYIDQRLIQRRGRGDSSDQPIQKFGKKCDEDTSTSRCIKHFDKFSSSSPAISRVVAARNRIISHQFVAATARQLVQSVSDNEDRGETEESGCFCLKTNRLLAFAMHINFKPVENQRAFNDDMESFRAKRTFQALGTSVVVRSGDRITILGQLPQASSSIISSFLIKSGKLYRVFNKYSLQEDPRSFSTIFFSHRLIYVDSRIKTHY